MPIQAYSFFDEVSFHLAKYGWREGCTGMAVFRAKKNTSNIHKTSPTRGERGAEGLTIPAQLKVNAKGGFIRSFNQGKNTKAFNE